MATQPAAQPSRSDPVRVDPNHYKAEMENDQVRVLRVRYGPHEKSIMHSHPSTIAVFLTDGYCRFSYPDGGTEEIRTYAGQVRHFAAFQHAVENLNAQSLELIAIELKK